MGNHYFTAFRTNGSPTLYPSQKTPVTADVLEAGLIFAAFILFFSVLVAIPGIYGFKGKASAYIKFYFGIFVTAAILLCNFGQDWEVGSVTTHTQYRAGIREEILARIEVKIGLRSINITLLADGETVVFNSKGAEITERINYNERFSWDNEGFTQGRAGFGPNAGRFNQEFRAAQFKGLPYPILWVAEYFTIDGDGIRWGRFYRQAGFYTHICMWLAFCCWLLSIIMVHIVVRYGAYMSILTGLVLFCANILYATIRNPTQLVIPLGERFLRFEWGWCFLVNLLTGSTCFVIGVVIGFLDLRASDKIAQFFGVHILSDYDEIYYTNDTAEASASNASISDATLDDSESDEYELLPSQTAMRHFRKKSAPFVQRFQKHPMVEPLSIEHEYRDFNF